MRLVQDQAGHQESARDRVPSLERKAQRKARYAADDLIESRDHDLFTEKLALLSVSVVTGRSRAPFRLSAAIS
jgi:hypothetical protein